MLDEAELCGIMWLACWQAFEVPASILSWVERNTLSSIFFYGEEEPLFQSETFPVEVYNNRHVGGLCSYVRDVVVQNNNSVSENSGGRSPATQRRVPTIDRGKEHLGLRNRH